MSPRSGQTRSPIRNKAKCQCSCNSLTRLPKKRSPRFRARSCDLPPGRSVRCSVATRMRSGKPCEGAGPVTFEGFTVGQMGTLRSGTSVGAFLRPSQSPNGIVQCYSSGAMLLCGYALFGLKPTSSKEFTTSPTALDRSGSRTVEQTDQN
jgi:hypothetical protein